MVKVHSKKLDQRNPTKPQQKQKEKQQKEKQKGGVDNCLKKLRSVRRHGLKKYDMQMKKVEKQIMALQRKHKKLRIKRFY